MNLSLKHKRLLLETIHFGSGYIIPGISGFCFGFFLNDKLELSVIFAIGFLYGLFYLLFFSLKVGSALEDIKKKEKQLIVRSKNIAILHQQLDFYRERLIFDDDQEYWKILEKLSD